MSLDPGLFKNIALLGFIRYFRHGESPLVTTNQPGEPTASLLVEPLAESDWAPLISEAAIT